MEPVIVPRSEHTISRKLIDPDAVKVLYRLHRAGYQAYLVGGGVRDLLVGRSPKDFDISTDAHPHQVKRLFRNCRLIGRRFRLAHVHFGEKIVEVSTFRRRSDPVDGESVEEDLLIRTDNTFGNAEEDALRRDFTINGLFYDIGSFSLIDYVGGLPDLNEKMIRTIGDPDIRFREDPVRMIRAIKFAARLGFQIETTTYEAILRHRWEISKSAQPRVLEEIFRLLGGGAAETSFRLLRQTGLLEILLPRVQAHIDALAESGPEGDSSFWRWLASLDRMKEQGVLLTNALLLAVLLGGMAFPVAAAEDDVEPAPLSLETEDQLREVLAEIGVPRRDTERLFQVYRAQRRLIGGRGRRFSPRAFVLKNYFHEAFLFFTVLSGVTGRYREAYERWEGLAGTAPAIATGTERRRRRRRRRRGGRDFDTARGNGSGEPDEEWVGSTDIPDRSRSGEEVRSRPGEEAAMPRARGNDAPPAPRPRGNEPARGPRVPGHDDDEDSQIRFLGWSDEPEILKSRSGPPPAVVNPYTRAGGRPEGRSGWRGHHGTGSTGGHRSGGRFTATETGRERPAASSAMKPGKRRGGRRRRRRD